MKIIDNTKLIAEFKKPELGTLAEGTIIKFPMGGDSVYMIVQKTYLTDLFMLKLPNTSVGLVQLNTGRMAHENKTNTTYEIYNGTLTLEKKV